MNLIDCTVTSLLSEPYIKYDHWWIKCEYVAEGIKGVTNIHFDTEEEAKCIKIGHKFLA